MIFETHAHYDDKAFEQDRDELLKQLPKAGIGRVVNIGADIQSCKNTLALMEKYPFVYGALGVHPSETASLTEKDMEWLKENCRHEKCVAVGEIGLDYHWPEPEKEIQKKWFIRQLELAREVKLPVVIHSREAAKDTVDIMRDLRAEEIGGIVHCFSYSRETAAVKRSETGMEYNTPSKPKNSGSKSAKPTPNTISRTMESMVEETAFPIA